MQTEFERKVCTMLGQWYKLCGDAEQSGDPAMCARLMEAHVEMERELKAHLDAWEPIVPVHAVGCGCDLCVSEIEMEHNLPGEEESWNNQGRSQ